VAYHNDFGREAERKASHYLLEIGYEIMERNWRFGKAEIDIIAKDNAEIVMVEVKARNYTRIIDPKDAVNLQKRKLLIKAANEYVQTNNLDFEVRFDIISLLKKEHIWMIEHTKHAFTILL